MSTTPEQLVATLSDLRSTYDSLTVTYVSDTNPDKYDVHKEQRQHDRAAIRRVRYENAVEARKLVEQLEELNDLLVQDSRRLWR